MTYFKGLNFIVYKLYFKKAIFKKRAFKKHIVLSILYIMEGGGPTTFHKIPSLSDKLVNSGHRKGV